MSLSKKSNSVSSEKRQSSVSDSKTDVKINSNIFTDNQKLSLPPLSNLKSNILYDGNNITIFS